MLFEFQTIVSVFLAAAIAATLLKSKQFISQLRGPPSPSWLYGHMEQILLAIPYGKFEFEWSRLYGTVYRVKGCFGSNVLMVSDSSAIRYIVNNSSIFIKPPHIQWINYIGFGSGSLLTAVDEQHRRLRAAMNPVFSPAELKKLVPTIQKAAWDGSQKFTAICDDNASSSPIDILPLLHNITLQTVGESIMGFNFTADETFTKCYENFVGSITERSKAGLIADAILPRLPKWVTSLLAYFPPQNLERLLEHREVTTKIADSVLQSKIDAQKLGLEPESDLISRLVYENAQASDQMSMEEIKDQFGTINAAGEDTTANALSWALYQLAGNAKLQNQLREEILQYSSSVTQGDYDLLPLLNAIIKETLRFHAPVPILARITNEDAVIPLSQSIWTTSGEETREIFVKKGQQILVAIQAYHRSTIVWGEDANQFQPSRWLKIDNGHGVQPGDGTSSIGPYANLLTFWGGSRTCIGWRYAILETQVMLCEFIRKFSFDISPNDYERVYQSYAITTVPTDSSGKFGLKLRINSL